MTYETLDWPSEAERVALAFGVVGECEFQNTGLTHSLKFIDQNGTAQPVLRGEGEYVAAVEYSAAGRRFSASRNYISLDSEAETRIHIGWDGSVRRVSLWLGEADFLAKALYHLGLLTPEVEAALKVSISSHQKAEWALD